jgi:cupin superfamily acireductone dioxygenase involved in methionine salvage
MTARRQARTRSRPGCGPRDCSRTNGATVSGDTYGWHEHGYEKVLYCVRGRIVFHAAGGDIEPGPGDKMVLPPHTAHPATAGAEGVRCIEAPRQRD